MYQILTRKYTFTGNPFIEIKSMYNNMITKFYYYRLKQWSRDGQYAYSPVRNVLFEYDKTIQVYPNPAKDQLQVSGLTTGGTIGIYNVSGGLIYKQEIDKPEVTINCRH